MCLLRILALAAVTAGLPLLAQVTYASEFAAVVSPPRFELRARPDQSMRLVVEVTNVGAQRAQYFVRTADWSLGADGGVTFFEEPVADSCRPWVAIERHVIEVPAGGRYRYRFDVRPPADAAIGECRFALMFEGETQTLLTEHGVALPVSGRIGVIVYVTLDGAAPDLQLVEMDVADLGNGLLPFVTLRNTGNAHGRLEGFLSGVDAAGRRLEFTPSSLPILAGETRVLPLTPSDGSRDAVDVSYPVRIKGVLEWGDGKRLALDHPFAW
jgi:fimbrial chaperone protein